MAKLKSRTRFGGLSRHPMVLLSVALCAATGLFLGVLWNSLSSEGSLAPGSQATGVVSALNSTTMSTPGSVSTSPAQQSAETMICAQVQDGAVCSTLGTTASLISSEGVGGRDWTLADPPQRIQRISVTLATPSTEPNDHGEVSAPATLSQVPDSLQIFQPGGSVQSLPSPR